MSRHDDSDAGWMEQVSSALEGLELFDPDVRRALVEGVREALQARAEDDRDNPAIMVFRGARPDAPAADGPPSLRVVGDHEGPAAEGPVTTARIKVAGRPRHDAPPADAAEGPLTVGHLRLSGDTDVWQTLRHGRGAATYRVHCDEGQLHVESDATLVARVEAGQSVDVEGAVIRAKATGGRALGRFALLHSPR